jgi:hypothetical protein
MPGIKVPEDRTIHQPAAGFCRNPECRDDDREFRFTVENDRFACPKCGADRSPQVGLLVLTHLLLPHPQGPILGKAGRWVIACDDERAYLATATNLEAATDNAKIANCPGCIAKAEQLGIKTDDTWKFQAR